MHAFLRNLLFFTVIGLATSACGGGAGISSNDGTGNGSGNPGGVGTGSVTLSWTAPTTLADTTAVSLSDISGYRIYYGTSATYTPEYFPVSSGATTQDTITLPSGTYYFRICAVDSSGHLGLLSTAVKKTL